MKRDWHYVVISNREGLQLVVAGKGELLRVHGDTAYFSGRSTINLEKFVLTSPDQGLRVLNPGELDYATEPPARYTGRFYSIECIYPREYRVRELVCGATCYVYPASQEHDLQTILPHYNTFRFYASITPAGPRPLEP